MAGPQERDSGSTATGALWRGAVPTDLGGDSFINFEFYTGIAAGTFDLTMGDNANYGTCEACIRVVTVDADGNLVKQYFQDGGTMTLSVDPLSTKHMTGTATGVSLIEVTIDPDTFMSTPVVGGTCLSLPDLTLNAGPAPLAWTCTETQFDDGTTCDCACGAHDLDCDLDAAPIAGCTAAQTCSQDACVATCNVLSTPPQGCTTGTCGYQNDAHDICYADPAAVSTAALGAACAAGPIFCAANNTVATGLCDVFSRDDETCRKACDANADCLGTELCVPILTTKGLCVPKVANDTCQTATTLTPVNGTTGGGVGNYDAGLQAATCTGFSQPGADVVYKVTLTAGQTITATLDQVTPDFDPSLSILGPGTAAAVCDIASVVCDKGADANFAGEGETFQYTTTNAGTYYVIVDSFSANQGGSFRLTVTSP
jgi:hypothetical protein